jgi:S1-C subfamily serine protease
MIAGLLLASVACAQEGDALHRRVYAAAGESVVAVRALAPLGERSGTGVVLSKDGLILTSYAVCPERSSKIRVRTRGPRHYEARIVGTSKREELTLLKIEPRGELKPIALGASSGIRVGDPSYTLGNAANSLWLDDEPSLNAGIVSGVYRLTEDRASSTYTGTVFETTAAVNVGMEGAPCLDAAGRMTGMVTLNYSPSRFLGAAIPIDELKPLIEKLRAGAAPPPPPPPVAEGAPYVGLSVREQAGKLVVESVEKGGPAERAGLQPGDVLLELANEPLKSVKDLQDRLRGLEPGSIVFLKVEVEGKPESLKLHVEAKK